MTHQFTEITETGWGTRLKNAAAGMVAGLVLTAAAFGLLIWNESRSLDAERALNTALALAVTVNPAALDETKDGRLVHVSGVTVTGSAVRDPLFAVDADKSLRLRRRVEMYQWHEHTTSTTRDEVGGGQTTRTTTEYRLEWSEQQVESANFRHYQGHENPRMAIRSQDFEAADARIGAYRLGPAVLAQIGDFRPLVLEEDGLGRRNGFVADGDHFFRGADPRTPALGDLRLGFEQVPNGTYSIMGRQADGEIAPYAAGPSYELLLVASGALTKEQMIDRAREAEAWLTWVARVGGCVLMVIGLFLLFGPLPALAAVIPVLGALAESSMLVLAIVLGLSLSALTIAGAWILVRPLWALAVAGGALLIAAGLYRWGLAGGRG